MAQFPQGSTRDYQTTAYAAEVLQKELATIKQSAPPAKPEG